MPSGLATKARIAASASPSDHVSLSPRSPSVAVSPSATNAAISARPASDERNPSISALPRRYCVTEDDSGHECSEEAGASGDRREPGRRSRLRRGRESGRAPAREPHVPHHREQRRAPTMPTARPTAISLANSVTTIEKSPSSSVASSTIPIIRAIPTGLSIRPALQDGARTSADLPRAEDRDRHRRVGRRDRRADEPGEDPLEAEDVVRRQCDGARPWSGFPGRPVPESALRIAEAARCGACRRRGSRRGRRR